DMARKPTSLLEEMLVAWAYTRDGVIDEVKNLPESALDFKPQPAMRPARELVQHIIESSLLMSGELPRPDGDFQRKSYPALLKEHAPAGVTRDRTKAELIAALKATHASGAKRFRAVGEIAMLQMIRQFDGSPCARLPRVPTRIAHERAPLEH